MGGWAGARAERAHALLDRTVAGWMDGWTHGRGERMMDLGGFAGWAGRRSIGGVGRMQGWMLCVGWSQVGGAELLIGGRADGRLAYHTSGDQRPVAGDEAAKETDREEAQPT